MFESLVTTCWRHVLQITVVWSVSDFLNPNQSQTMEFRFPLLGTNLLGGSASVSASDVTLLVTLFPSSMALSSVSAMLLCLCLLPSDRRRKRVLAGDVKMLQLHSPSYNKLLLNSTCGYPTLILTLSCALHGVLNHNCSVR